MLELSDQGDDGGTLQEVRSEDPGDLVGVEILQLGYFCNRSVLNIGPPPPPPPPPHHLDLS